MTKDRKTAKQIISDFVNRGDHNVDWHELALALIEPLALTEQLNPTQFQTFSRQAEAGIRSEWPESYSNKELWRSRTGAWCRDSGISKIMEIVEKTALRMNR